MYHPSQKLLAAMDRHPESVYRCSTYQDIKSNITISRNFACMHNKEHVFLKILCFFKDAKLKKYFLLIRFLLYFFLLLHCFAFLYVIHIDVCFKDNSKVSIFENTLLQNVSFPTAAEATNTKETRPKLVSQKVSFLPHLFINIFKIFVSSNGSSCSKSEL